MEERMVGVGAERIMGKGRHVFPASVDRALSHEDQTRTEIMTARFGSASVCHRSYHHKKKHTTRYLQPSDAAALKNAVAALSTTLDRRLLPDTMNSSYLSGLLTLNYMELLLESRPKIEISKRGLSKASPSSWLRSRARRRGDEKRKR